jgi:uncharacterized protein (PEP-CTERM system associated)
MSRPHRQFGVRQRHIQRLIARSCAPLLTGVFLQAAPHSLISTAAAAEWVVTPSIGVRQSFTDNATHAAPGRAKADTLTSVTPGVSIQGTGDRLNLNLDYYVTRNQYFDNTELSGNSQSLLGGGTAELIDELLYLDARAAIFQQTVDPTGPQSANSDANGSNTNTRTVRTYTLSPYLRNHLGSFADSELRYSFDQTRQGAAGTSTSNSISQTLTSGDDFTRFRWRSDLQASESKASNTSNTTTSNVNNPFGGPPRDTSKRLAVFSPEYAVNRYLILLSAVGYEKIEDPTLNDEPDGLTGNAGVRVNPGPRTTFRVLWNHRYNANYWTGDAAYLIGPTSRIEVAHTRDLNTSSSLYSQNLSYLGTDQYGNFIDTRSLAGFQLENQAFGLSNAAFLQKRTSLRYSTDIERDSLSAELYQEKRESQSSLANQTTKGVNLTWTRSVSELLTFNFGLTYTDSEFSQVAVGNEPREDQTLRGGPGLSYSFNETLTGTLNYDFLYRFSNAAGGDLRENIVTVGMRKKF